MRRFEGGYLTVMRTQGGALLRIHWTLVVAALVLGVVLPAGLGLWLGLLPIILLHEWGHVRAARELGAAVHSVDLWALGGQCRFEDSLSPLERSLVALAGPAVNLALTVMCLTVMALSESPGRVYFFASTGAAANLGIGLFNLLPLPPLDGRDALALPARWLRARTATRQVRAQQAQQVLSDDNEERPGRRMLN
jgi:Zn-dependent protease